MKDKQEFMTDKDFEFWLNLHQEEPLSDGVNYMTTEEKQALKAAIEDGAFDEEEFDKEPDDEYDGRAHWSEYYEAEPLTQARKIGGYAGILYAIIAQARIDAGDSNSKEKADALKYFGGEAYRLHLELLGLPSDWLPEGIKV